MVVVLVGVGSLLLGYLKFGFNVYKYFDEKKKKPPGSPDSSNV